MTIIVKVFPLLNTPRKPDKIFSGINTCQTLFPSEIPGYNFKYLINDRFQHFNITAPLKRYIPVELNDIVLVLDYINDPVTFNDDMFYLAVKDLYPKRWIRHIEEKKAVSEIRLENLPLTNGFLIEGLYSIYSERFQTAREFEKHLSIFENEQRLTHSTKIYSLCNYGILDKEILKTELENTVSKEYALHTLIRLLNKDIEEKDAVDFALNNKLLLPHEEQMPFNLLVFANVLIRIKESIPVSPNYSGIQITGSGLWHTITDLKENQKSDG